MINTITGNCQLQKKFTKSSQDKLQNVGDQEFSKSLS